MLNICYELYICPIDPHDAKYIAKRVSIKIDGISITPYSIQINSFYFKKSEARKLVNTGGPPLTQFSLLRIPLPWFLAYVRASGGFLH